jgi:hypothetical protein
VRYEPNCIETCAEWREALYRSMRCASYGTPFGRRVLAPLVGLKRLWSILVCKICGGGVLVGMGYLYLRYGKFDRSTL